MGVSLPHTKVSNMKGLSTILLAFPVLSLAQPSSSACSSDFCKLMGFNLGEKVRFEWDRQLPKINLMAVNPTTAPLIQEMVDVNPCVDTLDAYNALMELGTRYIEVNSEEIESFYMNTLSLQGEKNMTALFKKYAVWYTQLDNIWDQVTSFRCQSNPAEFIKAIRGLGYALHKMSLVEDIDGLSNAYVRGNYAWSARALDAFANSADHFMKALNKVDCYSIKDALYEWTELSAVATDEVATFMGALGYYENARNIRVRANFVHSLATTLKNWPVKVPRGETCQGGRLQRAAAFMDDIADTIAKEGLQNLAVKYGVVFRLDLL